MPPRQGDDRVHAGLRKRRGSGVGSSGDALVDPVEDAKRHGVDPPQPSNGASPGPPPLAAPTFTAADIRAAIPKHCFERSALRSFAYLFWDLARIGALMYGSTFIDALPAMYPALPAWSTYVLWPAYWVVVGIIMTGVWVIAHECGHQAFSDSKTLNDAVGLVCHSALLVPYHSWRITHGNHHKHTSSVEDDEVFLPATRSQFAKEMVAETPIASAVGIFNMLVFGWPLYLTLNIAGPDKYKGVPNSHFNPSSRLFAARDWLDIVVSDIVFFLALAGIAASIQAFGFAAVAKVYLVPYLIVNYHLVLITYLQHTDVYIPHFRRSEFTWLRGALCTVDRSFGRLYDDTIHGIASTHVCHHLYSQMPHYHAEEATEAIRRVIGPYYLKDDTPIWTALWNAWRHCNFIEDEGGIVFYKQHGM